MDLKTLAEIAPWDWPKETGQVLIDALRDDGLAPSDRMIAVELAGNFAVVSDDLVAELVSVVGDAEAPENLRTRAVIALGPSLESGDTDGFDEDYGAPISERCFLETNQALWELYRDTDLPKEVRRRILEATVRAPQDWHQVAIREAYASADDDWKLTAVFAMEFVQGFDEEIIEALGSENDEIEYQAILAAKNWALDGAWPHVKGVVTSGHQDKEVFIAAIEAVGSIRPGEVGKLLADLINCDDEDIVEAIHEAMLIAELSSLADAEAEDDKTIN